MRKVRLDVSKLEVQSFSTGTEMGSQGTVHAHTGRFPCYTAVGCFSAGVPECNTFNDPTCGEAEWSCDPSCDPRLPCCATDGAASCPATTGP